MENQSKKLGKRTQRKNRTKLSDYIRACQDEGDITREMIVADSDGKISMGYLNSILDGGSRNLTIPKLKALAKGLHRPETELAAVLDLNLSVEIAPELIALSEILGQLSPSDRAHTQTLIRNVTDYARELLNKTNKNGTSNY